VQLKVHVTPRAKRTRVAGLHGDKLKICLAAPPVDGKANKTLATFVEDLLGCSSVEISHGLSGRDKTLTLQGLSLEEVAAKLDEILSDG
jgi:uncharacterized protein